MRCGFFFSSRRRHTRFDCDWSSDVCSSDLPQECIVVDDGSTDESAETARNAGVTVLSTGGRRGPAVARNLGAKAARGEVLFFLDRSEERRVGKEGSARVWTGG